MAFKHMLSLICILLLLASAFLFAGCNSDETNTNGDSDQPESSDGDLDDSTDGDRNNHTDGDEDADIKEIQEVEWPEAVEPFYDDDPILTPTGPRDCLPGQGFLGNRCGACTTAAQCRELEGCRANGQCGACSADAQCRSGEHCIESFCMPALVGRADLEMDPADFQALLDGASSGIETFYDCVLTVDGVRYDNGEQIRILGSFSRSFPKSSFRIRFPEDVDHPGFARKINYKADWDDPTFMRSFLSYHTYRALTRIPTPRVRYKQLYVNGDYYGLMVEIERIGGNFLETNGRNRDNAMYEMGIYYPGGAFVPMPDESEYPTYYHKKTGDEEDYSDLIQFIETAIWPDFEESDQLDRTRHETVTTRTRPLLHVSAYMNYLAGKILIQDPDSTTNNFYFSWQTNQSGKSAWEFYPWDMDLTLGCYFDSEPEDICDEDHMRSDHWWLNGLVDDDDDIGPDEGYPECWANVLIHITQLDPELGKQIRQNICEMLDSDYWQTRLPRLPDALDEVLWESISADPNDRNDSRSDFLIHIGRLKDFLEGREEYLREQVECEELRESEE